jgi:hypothetical protein
MTQFNGWTNKETWLVNLWLSEYFQQEIETGQEICTTHIKDTINNMLADAPEMWGLFSDLIEMAIANVNCEEIASHYQGTKRAPA